MACKEVVIIGGGITGLSAAHQLFKLAQEADFPVHCTLIEESATFGGKIRTLKQENWMMELGPDSVFTLKPRGVEFMKQLGMEAEIVPVNSGGKTFIYHDHRLDPLPGGVFSGIPTDLMAFAKSRLISPLGKLRALGDLILQEEHRLDDISVGDFLQHRLGSQVVEMIAAPLLAGIHAGDIHRLSLHATMPALRKLRESHRSMLLSAMGRKKPPSTPSRVAAPRAPVFVNLENGLESLIDRLKCNLQETNSTTLVPSTRALQIMQIADHRYQILIDSAGETRLLEADAVIVAVPAYAAAELVSTMSADFTPLRLLRYASTATVGLGYTGQPLPSYMTGSGFLIPANQGMTATACTIVSNKWPYTTRSSGMTMLRCYVGRDGDEGALSWDDAQIISAVKRDLTQVGIHAQPEIAFVTRWPAAMPQYDVNHLIRIKKLEEQEDAVPGFSIAGAAYRGLGIPDCIKDADRAAQRIMKYFQS